MGSAWRRRGVRAYNRRASAGNFQARFSFNLCFILTAPSTLRTGVDALFLIQLDQLRISISHVGFDEFVEFNDVCFDTPLHHTHCFYQPGQAAGWYFDGEHRTSPSSQMLTTAFAFCDLTVLLPNSFAPSLRASRSVQLHHQTNTTHSFDPVRHPSKSGTICTASCTTIALCNTSPLSPIRRVYTDPLSLPHNRLPACCSFRAGLCSRCHSLRYVFLLNYTADASAIARTLHLSMSRQRIPRSPLNAPQVLESEAGNSTTERVSL